MGRLTDRLKGKIKSTDSLGKAYRTVIQSAFGSKLEKSIVDELVIKIKSDPKLSGDVLRLIGNVLSGDK